MKGINNPKTSGRVRRIVQIIFFALVLLISVNHYLSDRNIVIPLIGTASLHAICPFGGVEAFFGYVLYGTTISRIHSSSYILLGLILLSSILLGTVVCAYICPLGSIQEWLGGLGRRIFGRRYNQFVPKKLDLVMRQFRYVVLIAIVYLSTKSLSLIFLEADPYHALFNFWTGEATIGGLIILGFILLLSLFIERPWCKYACPMGALLGLTNLIAPFKINRRSSTCISCNKCNVACPMNIDVAGKKTISDPQCIRCMKCTSEVACPVDDTVKLSLTPLGKLEVKKDEQ